MKKARAQIDERRGRTRRLTGGDQRPAAISRTRPLTFTARRVTATTPEGEVIARQAVTRRTEEDVA